MAEKVVFKPILPKHPNLFKDIERELTSAMASTMTGRVAKTLKNAEEDRMDGWDHKPKIVSRFWHQKRQLKLHVTPFGTNKRYWVWTSLGTKGANIKPKNYDLLFIKPQYKSKTTPNNVWGRTGTYASGRAIMSEVYWPGIEPRNFEKYIVKTERINILNMMSFAVKQTLRKYQ